MYTNTFIKHVNIVYAMIVNMLLLSVDPDAVCNDAHQQGVVLITHDGVHDHPTCL